MLSKQYDKYYLNGKKSIYNSRFGKIKVPTHDINLLKNAFNITLKSKYKIQDKSPINIIDYGCGDGRYNAAIFNMIKKSSKKYPKIKFNLYGLDISPVGIELYKQNLLDLGLSKQKNLRFKKVYKKNNIKAIPLLISEKDDFEDIFKTINIKFDIVLCLFGVLSHIPFKKNRQKLLKTFFDNTKQNGSCLITVPSYGILKKELKAYNTLRKQGKPCNLATEDGDLYYNPQKDFKKNDIICNYHHLYKINEIKSDIKASSYHIKNSGVLSCLFATKIKTFTISKLDEMCSKLLSLFFIPSFIKNKTSYIFVHAIKK